LKEETLGQDCEGKGTFVRAEKQCAGEHEERRNEWKLRGKGAEGDWDVGGEKEKE
jgi:hypothetical protein